MIIKHADCNDEIKKLIEDEIPKKEFTHFFIDPFNMGNPPIQSETVKLCLERPNSELVLFFPWEQSISRPAGYAKFHEPEEKDIKTMDNITAIYFGDDQWKEIENSLPPQKERTKEQIKERRMRYVELYKSKLEGIFKGVKYVEIPINSNKPKYYLFFAANYDAQPEIFSDMVQTTRIRKRKMKAKIEAKIEAKKGPNLTDFLNIPQKIEVVDNSKPTRGSRAPRWRNIGIRDKDYCARLKGKINSVQKYCTLDVNYDNCIYRPLLI